jgi:hypothetical protein
MLELCRGPRRLGAFFPLTEERKGILETSYFHPFAIHINEKIQK